MKITEENLRSSHQPNPMQFNYLQAEIFHGAANKLFANKVRLQPQGFA